MKKLLFILFFPITVPTYLFCRIAIWFFQWFGETYIPFLLNRVFPTIKRFIQKQSAEMEKNAEKIKQERKKEKTKKNENVQSTAKITNNELVQPSAEPITQEQLTEEPVEISVSINNSSTSGIDPKLEERVFILFYSVGTAKRFIKDCTNPNVFFENYSDAVDCLQELTKIESENTYPFYEPFPSEQLKELQEHNYYVNLVNEFIKRYWYKILNEASKYKTDAKIKEKINTFKSNLEPFASSIPSECQKIIEQLASLELDIHNLPKAPKKHIEFDSFTEQSLLNTLKNQTDAYSRHCCYNELIDFYFKYRNNYPKAVWECIKYCVEDIESLSNVETTYVNQQIEYVADLYSHDLEKRNQRIQEIKERGLRATIPAFDRITMLYYYEKDYESAIYYCKLAIGYGHGQDHDLKYTKRIERFKKKRAAEEKKLYGTELSHAD